VKLFVRTLCSICLSSDQVGTDPAALKPGKKKNQSNEIECFLFFNVHATSALAIHGDYMELRKRMVLMKTTALKIFVPTPGPFNIGLERCFVAAKEKLLIFLCRKP
jgi:hypothetical protein